MNRNTERAVECAKEYARHIRSGDVTLAEQTERTIDDLVGRFRPDGKTFVWPARVAMTASVTVVRMVRA